MAGDIMASSSNADAQMALGTGGAAHQALHDMTASK